MIKKRIVRLLAAFMVTFIAFAGTPAKAQTYPVTQNYSNNWWGGPSQSGWGMDIIQQQQVIYAQLYVYNATMNPMFFSFGDGRALAKDAQGRDSYSGDLLISHGMQPTRFDASKTTANKVGTMSIAFTDVCHATFTYSYTDPSDGSTQAGSINITPVEFGQLACVIPKGVKIADPQAVPQGCVSQNMQCWKDALASGKLKFLSTSATMVGFNSRPIMFGYFIDGTGYYRVTVFYADTGEAIGGDTTIINGLALPLGWVEGTSDGLLQRLNDQDGGIALGPCALLRWFPPAGYPGYVSGYANVWASLPAPCS